MKNTFFFLPSKRAAAVLAVAFCCSAFTITLVEKQGSKEVAEALQHRDAGEYPQAAALLKQAMAKAKDDETKARAYTELGKLSIRSHVPETPPASGLKLLQEAEKLGSINVLLPLGQAYHYGLGTPVDIQKAVEYYRKAAPTAPRAYYETALIQKASLPQLAAANMQKYITQLQENPAQMSHGAALLIARQYRDGGLLPVNLAQAEEWYLKAIELGSKTGLVELASLWQQQNHQPASEIIALWQQAAAQGRGDALMKLGYILAEGKIVPADMTKAEQYFKQAAAQDAAKMYRVARFYEVLSETNPAMFSKALTWMNSAVAKGHTDAMLRLAGYYRKGRGVAQDTDMANNLYKQAASLGNRKAAEYMRLAAEKERLQTQKRSQRSALRKQKNQSPLLRQANLQPAPAVKISWEEVQAGAKQGDPIAMREMGRAYMKGKNVEHDETAGIEWLNKAAQAGDGEAMVDLAKAYESGSGETYDLRKAYGWYEKAAEAGVVKAQYQLGLGYARGIGVEKNVDKAKHWLEMARDHGYSAATGILNKIEQ